jgi:hypothetical protein
MQILIYFWLQYITTNSRSTVFYAAGRKFTAYNDLKNPLQDKAGQLGVRQLFCKIYLVFAPGKKLQEAVAKSRFSCTSDMSL